MNIHNREKKILQDFYKFVNQDWMIKNKIPPDYQKWSNFNILYDNNMNKIRTLLDKIKGPRNEFESLEILYNQGLDTDKINSISCINYVAPYLKIINTSSSKNELLDNIFNIHVLHNFNTPYQMFSGLNFNDSANNILYISTGGLGLPDREYYFSVEKIEFTEKYKIFLKAINEKFSLNIDINNIYEIEKNLAKFTYTKVEARDPCIINNPISYKNVKNMFPSIPINILNNYLKKMNINLEDKVINITNIKFFENYNKLWKDLSLEVWKEYYIMRFLIDISSYINSDIENLRWNFYDKILSGVLKMKPRWKIVVDNCNSKMGFLIGKLFVKKYFSKEAKKVVLEIVKYIKKELSKRLNNLEWMSPPTKKNALEKLDKINVKIGYPHKWKNYSGLNLSRNNSYLENNLKCLLFERNYNLNKLYKIRNPDEWFMHPQDVNAYYSPSYNEIVFPSGILQEPFFSLEADTGENFGGIGSVIGHEIIHAFDDQGRKYDSMGNLKNWWNNNDIKEYNKKTELLVQYFSNCKLHNKNINGKLTLGENIADLGGVITSFYSLLSYLKDNPSKDKVTFGFNVLQNFFINYAKVWRSNIRKEEEIKRLITDPHAPPIFRVNNILYNLKEFYQVFNLNIPDRNFIKIW